MLLLVVLTRNFTVLMAPMWLQAAAAAVLGMPGSQSRVGAFARLLTLTVL